MFSLFLFFFIRICHPKVKALIDGFPLNTEEYEKTKTIGVKVNNITCRAVIDTGAESYYVSSTLMEKRNERTVSSDGSRI